MDFSATECIKHSDTVSDSTGYQPLRNYNFSSFGVVSKNIHGYMKKL